MLMRRYHWRREETTPTTSAEMNVTRKCAQGTFWKNWRFGDWINYNFTLFRSCGDLTCPSCNTAVCSSLNLSWFRLQDQLATITFIHRWQFIHRSSNCVLRFALAIASSLRLSTLRGCANFVTPHRRGTCDYEFFNERVAGRHVKFCHHIRFTRGQNWCIECIGLIVRSVSALLIDVLLTRRVVMVMSFGITLTAVSS